MTRQTVPLAAILWLVGLTLAWGGGWPAMKHVVGEMPIFTFRTLSGVGGGICVLALSALQGQSLVLPRSEWRITAIAAFFNVTCWFYFTAVALLELPAGRSVVLAYTMPLWAVIAARLMVKDAITMRKIGGLALGMIAVALLIGDDLARLGRAPLGVLAILAAAATWAIGTIIQKRHWETPLLTLAGWQLLIGVIPIAVLMPFLESDPFANVTVIGAWSMAYVILVACLFGYWAWFSIVKLVPTAVASIAVLPVPLVGVMSSSMALGEPIGWPEIGALVFITAALATLLPTPNLRLWRR
ncbi:MAG: DMT family transporter [Alphaproteobacteria bacterium]|nr:DMT family transporter [Alphaproteobacteria bacterium]